MEFRYNFLHDNAGQMTGNVSCKDAVYSHAATKFRTGSVQFFM